MQMMMTESIFLNWSYLGLLFQFEFEINSGLCISASMTLINKFKRSPKISNEWRAFTFQSLSSSIDLCQFLVCPSCVLSVLFSLLARCPPPPLLTVHRSHHPAPSPGHQGSITILSSKSPVSPSLLLPLGQAVQAYITRQHNQAQHLQFESLTKQKKPP